MGKPSRATMQQVAVSMLTPADVYPTAAVEPAILRSLLASFAPMKTDKSLIRLGGMADGGYLVPDDLDEIEACFSPGVSTTSAFEKSCGDRGMKIYLADKSVVGPAEAHDLFHFTRKHVGATSATDVMTMAEWVHDSLDKSNSDLLLQMDIEGAEYETLLAIPDELLRRFRIAVFEFHWLDHLWSKPFFNIASAAFRKLLHSHVCVHIHPNNCCGSLKRAGLEMPRVAEFTFLRKDRVGGTSPATNFPHPLDADNTGNPPLPLPACWIAEAT
jgi:hypothetical protein